jgi:hypothetical protein
MIQARRPCSGVIASEPPMHINAMGTEAEPSDSSARRRKEGNVTPKRGTSGPSSGYEKRPIVRISCRQSAPFTEGLLD